jgi:NADH-quinone oxidoreductase subunit J
VFLTVILLALSFLAIIFAIGMLYSREIVHAVIYIAGLFIILGLIYFMLDNTFLGAVQILIYGGAVTVLLMFGVMLTKREIMDKKESITTEYEYVVLIALTISIYIGTLFTVSSYPLSIYYMSMYTLSTVLFNSFIGAFVVMGVIIMSSIIGAIYMVKEVE